MSITVNNNISNQRDEILEEIKSIKTQFLSGNTWGKSFFGIEIVTRIIDIIGDKKLLDLSTNKTYTNWHIGIEHNEFIVMDGKEEKVVKYEDVVIIV